MATLALAPASQAEEITRFKPLKAEELTPPQKAWADEIAVPPRNAKFGNPPYRAIMDIIGTIGYYDLVSMTLIAMQAPPNDSVKPLPVLGK